MLIEFAMYGTNVGGRPGAFRWAESLYEPPGAGEMILVPLKPVYGSAAALYRLTVRGEHEHPEAGWFAYRAELVIEGWSGGIKPLSVYLGEPTDWPSGLVSYFGAVQYADGPRRYPPTDLPGPVWTLTARRAE